MNLLEAYHTFAKTTQQSESAEDFANFNRYNQAEWMLHHQYESEHKILLKNIVNQAEKTIQ